MSKMFEMKSVFLLGIVFFVISLFVSCDPSLGDISTYIEGKDRWPWKDLPPHTDEVNDFIDEAIPAINSYLKNKYSISVDSDKFTNLSSIENYSRNFEEGNIFLTNDLTSSHFVPLKTKKELEDSIVNIGNLDYSCDNDEKIIIPFDNENLFRNIINDIAEREDKEIDVDDNIWKFRNRFLIEGTCDGGIFKNFEYSDYCAIGNKDNNAEEIFHQIGDFEYECYNCAIGNTKSSCSGRSLCHYTCNESGEWEKTSCHQCNEDCRAGHCV